METANHHDAKHKLYLAAVVLLAISPLLCNGFYNAEVAQTPWLFWLIDVLGNTLLPAMVCLLIYKKRWVTPSKSGLHREIFRQSKSTVLILLCISLPPVMVWLDAHLLALAIALFPDSMPLVNMSYADILPPRGPTTGWARLAAAFYMSISAGLFEELFFRGMLRALFGKGILHASLFVVVSSALFALAHWEGGTIKLFYTACWGVLTSLAYLAMGNLWPLILGHFLVDLCWYFQS